MKAATILALAAGAALLVAVCGYGCGAAQLGTTAAIAALTCTAAALASLNQDNQRLPELHSDEVGSSVCRGAHDDSDVGEQRDTATTDTRPRAGL